LQPGSLEVMKASVALLGDDPEKIIDYLGSSMTYILDTLAAKNKDGSKKHR
jgi:hypothetical protein